MVKAYIQSLKIELVPGRVIYGEYLIDKINWAPFICNITLHYFLHNFLAHLT